MKLNENVKTLLGSLGWFALAGVLFLFFAAGIASMFGDSPDDMPQERTTQATETVQTSTAVESAGELSTEAFDELTYQYATHMVNGFEDIRESTEYMFQYNTDSGYAKLHNAVNRVYEHMGDYAVAIDGRVPIERQDVYDRMVSAYDDAEISIYNYMTGFSNNSKVPMYDGYEQAESAIQSHKQLRIQLESMYH